MPLVKATLPTALSTVRQLLGDLKKTVRDIGSSPALDNLVSSLDAVDAYGTRKGLDVEIVILSPLDPDEAGKIAAWIGPGFHPGRLLAAAPEPAMMEVPGPPLDLRVQTRTATGRLVQKAGTPRAPVLVVLATKPFALSEDDRTNLERAFEDRPHITLVASAKKLTIAAPPAPSAEAAEGGEAAPAETAPPPEPPSPADEPWFKDLESKAKSGAWTCMTMKTITETTLQARLSSPPMDGFHDLFKAHSSAVALESLAGVFDMVMTQQANEIRMNKSVATQKMAKYGTGKPGGAAPPSPIADLLADLKARVQRLSQEFERGAADRLQDLLGQPAGMLVRETEQLLASLDDLEMEEKTKTMGCKVPPAFEERVNKLIREKVGRHCAVDLVALNDLFRLIGQEFDRTLTQAQGPPIVVQFRYLTDERVRRMLDMYGIFQSAYKGEMPRPGFGEYFSSVRKYSMILVMVASMFGLSALVRQYREFTVPLTVLLVAFGTYQVAVGTKRSRVENTETQLENARVAMRTDIRKIIQELQKQWATILNQYLNEQISGAIGELDATLKMYQGRKGPVDADPERERLQRQLQALDASEKRMVATTKSKETVTASITQVRGDLKGLMAAPGAAPGMARPGMPGVPGMPGMPPRPGVPGMPPRPGMPGAGGAGMAGARPGMPAKPAAPSPMAEAKAKLEAMKAAKAAPAAAKPAAAPAAPAAAPAAPAAAAEGAGGFAAKMAAMKAARAGGAAPAADAAAPAAAAPAAPAEAAAAAPPAAAEAKPSAAGGFAAKMAAMKAAKAGGAAPAADAGAPAAAAPAAAPAAAEAKPSAAGGFAAKMAAMKAAKAAGAAPAADAAAPAAAAPAADAAAPEAAAAAPAAAEAKPSAAGGFAAKMAAMKAAKAGGAAAGAAAAGAAAAAAAPAPEPAAEAAAEEPPAAEAEPEAPAEPATLPGGPEEAPEGEHGFAETMAIPPAEKVD